MFKIVICIQRLMHYIGLLNMKNILLLLSVALIWNACSFTKQIESGEAAFDRKQYDIAVPLLLEEFESASGQLKARKAYLLGESYRILKETDESSKWYNRAVKAGYGNEAKLKLARSFKRLEKYKEAVTVYNDLLQKLPNDPTVNRELAIAKQAINWAKNVEESIKLNTLDINSPYADYGATFFEEDYIIFTSDRESATGTEIYNWTGNKFSDLYIVHKQGNQPQLFDGLLNSEKNDGSLCLSSDGLELYFTRCFSLNSDADGACKIMYSYRDNGIWTEPEVIPFFDGSVSYGQPALIENDSVLVFVAKRQEGKGGFDLYYSVMEEGRWTEPYLMPSSINTEGDEYFPTAFKDTLYFSSNYLPGLGGLDVFKTYLRNDGSWSPPHNMMPPINSGEDDFHYVRDPSFRPIGNALQTGFVSSNREGFGDDDILRWTKYTLQEVEEPVEVEEEEEEPILVYLAGKVVTNQREDDSNPNSEIIGKSPIPNAYIKLNEEDGFTTDENGFFVKELVLDKDYRLRASKEGYLNNIIDVSTIDLLIPEGESSITINVELLLDKIYTGVEIVLENIYYDFDKWKIRPDAEPTLLDLAKLLRDNPQINIELSSHTDCQGDVDYNQELSYKRARSAVQYISRHGVKAERITPIGYGESNLANTCVCEDCTEAEHQENRRTTFKIL